MICNNCKEYFKFSTHFGRIHCAICNTSFYDIIIDDYLQEGDYDINELIDIDLYYRNNFRSKPYQLEAHIKRLQLDENCLCFNYSEEFIKDFEDFSKNSINDNIFGSYKWFYNLPVIISNTFYQEQYIINQQLSKRYHILEFKNDDYFTHIYILGLKIEI